VNKQRVLFLCTHNSARSQMAEGFLRSMAGDRFEVASAGTEATRVHPLAVRAMMEFGVDVSRHTSKIVDQFVAQPWDYVITVCDAANEACPMFPQKSSRLHWSFDDPSQATGSDDQKLEVFRQIRDQIKRRIADWIRAQ
jgi:arsenate reductase (thioredoxin)